jgi:hypothetical protein
MYLTKQEDIRNRTISATIAVCVFSLVFLFFILQKLVTPNPPFPKGNSSSCGGISFATIENEQINYDQMGITTDVVQKEEILTSKNSNVSISTSKETKALSAVQQLSLKYRKSVGKINNSNDAHSYHDGKQNGPTGNDIRNSITNGIVDPSANQKDFKVDLVGSKLLYMPTLPKDITEEGKVVVNIIVDAEGVVTSAEANGRGTTTSSAVLRSKARQAALATKFNVDTKIPERRGSITIIFAFE